MAIFHAVPPARDGKIISIITWVQFNETRCDQINLKNSINIKLKKYMQIKDS